MIPLGDAQQFVLGHCAPLPARDLPLDQALGCVVSADVVATEDGYAIQGHGCALGQTVTCCSETCCMVEQLLAEVTGGEVHEQCDRSQNPPHCGFRISE